MLDNWEDRSTVIANLFNPAFCGEIIRRTINSYSYGGEQFPFLLTFLVLPIVLHKDTRKAMPLKSTTYFHSWVEKNEYLFIDFSERVREMNPFTREAMLFMLQREAIKLNEEGMFTIPETYQKKNLKGDGTEEVKEIFQKAEMLGKWLRATGNVQTIFMFLKIRP